MTRRRVGVLVVCGVCLTLASPPTRRLDAQGNGGIEARPGAVARTPADAELQGGLQAYKAKDFVRARAHFQAALRLDPTGTYAALFLARSIHAQYRPGVATAENTATAREAIAAYRQVLAKNPNQDEAYEAGVLLYEALREDAELREWVLQRARSQSVPTGRRAAAYLFLARKDWACSRQASTEGARAHGDGQTVPGSSSAARQCAMHGDEMAQQAIGLSPDNPTAWAYKSRLLLELARLTEMLGQGQQRDEYLRQAAVAQARATELEEKNQQTMESVRSY